jgi:hypothetical protein
MPKHQSHFDFRWSQMDADKVGDLLAMINPAGTRVAFGVTLTQAGYQLLAQFA